MFKEFFNKITFRESYIEPVQTIDDVDAFAWDQQVDLAIAGFGGAGAAAAIEAHDNGLDTLVIDRFSGGGATNISGGIYYAGGGTAVQQEAGVEDSSENMFNYLQQEVQGAVTDETLRRFCDQSVENYQWMTDNGVPFDASFCPFKTSYPPNNYYFYYSGNESFAPYSDKATPAARGHRAHKPGISGNAIYQPLRQATERRGIKVQTQTKLIGLLKDQSNNIIGLKTLRLHHNMIAKCVHKLLDCSSHVLRYMALYYPPLFNAFAALTESIERRFGQVQYIHARKGVVLATGGFYSNQTMIKEHAPKFLGGSPLGTLADDGSGIQLAMQAGAATDLMDSVSAWRFINPPLSFVKGILVGNKGERICNEMLYGAQVGEQMMANHEGIAWVILDAKTYKDSAADLTLKKGLWFHVMLGLMYRKLGYKKATTIKELAQHINVSSDQLQQTFDEYNRVASSDEPDTLGKPKDYMPALGDGPYYAINASYHNFFVPCPSLTLGGLKVDEQSGLVLDQQGQSISGLYAAGRTAVGIASRGYVSGLSIADCVFSGRRASQHAASH